MEDQTPFTTSQQEDAATTAALAKLNKSRVAAYLIATLKAP